MNEETELIEKQRIQQVADEYREKGYDVQVEPDKSTLPPFLQEFHLDILARSEKECVVVEVKSKASLRGADYLASLADAVQKQPGWRFELVVTNPEIPKIDVGKASSLSVEAVKYYVDSAQVLLTSNQDRAAFVTLWAALEAAMRETARAQKIDMERDSPTYVIKTLYSFGLLSHDDYDFLNICMRIRNKLVHGFEADEPVHTYARQLITLVEKLLASQIETKA